MKKLLIGVACAAALAGPAAAGDKHHGQYKHAQAKPEISRFHGGTIVVSCFRGPWREVIWDRPNSNFVDSLVAIGYDYPNAHAIAERVCRDDELVKNPEGLKAEMRRIYYNVRSRRTQGH